MFGEGKQKKKNRQKTTEIKENHLVEVIRIIFNKSLTFLLNTFAV